ncbi:MAG: hypothetical protein HY865_24320 [Chloroflexi bacterium]|nr:hypothetical protein [Chloroflexota bacterium]
MNKRILKNDFLQIEYLTDWMRVVGLSLTGKPNLMADVTSQPPTPTPYGDYLFIGGHRLWHAPEDLPRSYIPDNETSITELPDGVILESKTEPGTGIRKQIEIRLAADKPSVTLTHTLINDGMWAVELAPWAITQLRLGGTAILPMPVGNSDAAGLLHNRQLSLWPYTHMNDPRMKWDDKFILFKADALPPFKVGYFNPHGWLAYWLDGVLFRKTFDAYADLPYPDNNCNAEMYCGERFVELESLAPLLPLDPGDSTTHTEKWDLFTGLDVMPQEVRIALG